MSQSDPELLQQKRLRTLMNVCTDRRLLWVNKSIENISLIEEKPGICHLEFLDLLFEALDDPMFHLRCLNSLKMLKFQCYDSKI